MFAPKDQQLEGLRSVLSQISFGQFLRALDVLTLNKFLSKSQRYRYIKEARHILGISYEDYINGKY